MTRKQYDEVKEWANDPDRNSTYIIDRIVLDAIQKYEKENGLVLSRGLWE